MWSDQRRGVTDVYSIYSSDAGNSWSSVQRVNNDSAMNHHFFPSMAIPIPLLDISFLPFMTGGNYLDSETDVYLARSTDGGQSFDNTRISQSAFGPDSGVFFGDYIHIAAYNRKVFPIWMRMDDSLLSVWTAIVQDTGTLTETPTNSVTIEATGSIELPGIDFTIAEYGHVDIGLFDVLPAGEISTILDGTYGAGEYRIPIPQSIVNGSYFAQMTSLAGINVAKINISR